MQWKVLSLSVNSINLLFSPLVCSKIDLFGYGWSSSKIIKIRSACFHVLSFFGFGSSVLAAGISWISVGGRGAWVPRLRGDPGGEVGRYDPTHTIPTLITR